MVHYLHRYIPIREIPFQERVHTRVLLVCDDIYLMQPRGITVERRDAPEDFAKIRITGLARLVIGHQLA